MNVDGAALAKRARATWAEYFRRATVHEILMGAQDNLTNVLAVVLGVTIGTGRTDFVALAGLSAGIAESISMGGVLYNATRAELRLEASTGVTRSAGASRLAPLASGVVTFAAAMIAGFIPLIPFAVLPVGGAVWAALGLSISALFLLGSLTGRLAGDNWLGEGLRLVVIAGLAALAAALLGAALQVT